jgi:hypothetical protein
VTPLNNPHSFPASLSFFSPYVLPSHSPFFVPSHFFLHSHALTLPMATRHSNISLDASLCCAILFMLIDFSLFLLQHFLERVIVSVPRLVPTVPDMHDALSRFIRPCGRLMLFFGFPFYIYFFFLLLCAVLPCEHVG